VIRLAVPGLGDAEVAAAAEVLRSGMLVQGAEVSRFEALVATRTARKHAIAVANGTTALELALAVLGVGTGDEVLVPDLTWPSPAHAVIRAGALPVFVDVDLREWNSSPAAFAALRNSRTKAAIVIDQFGMPARLSEIAAALPGLPLLEDAACAIGSIRGDGTPAGSAPGLLATLSFHPRKVVTTGEGGMIVTDDEALASELRIARNHGQRAAGEFVSAGPNARLGEVAGAIGRVQMERLDAMLEARRRFASQLREALPMLTYQAGPPATLSNVQTLGALVPLGTTPGTRDLFVAACRAREVEVGKLSYALHRLPPLAVYAPLGEGDRAYPNASAIVDRGIALPLWHDMDEATIDCVVDAVRSAFAEAL
jgi:perosamine synthetase